MQKHRPGLLSLSLRCGLMLLVLMPFAEAAQAQSSEEYPGPWREITQDVREFLALHKVPATKLRDGNRRAISTSTFCTAPETRNTGQAGACSLRHANYGVPTNSSKEFQYQLPMIVRLTFV
jgi:threonine synthase